MICDIPPRDSLRPARARRGFQGFSVLTLAWLLGLGALGCGNTELVPGKSQPNPLDVEELNLVLELDQVRKDAGITAPLLVCKSLNQSASDHSDDMRDQGYLRDTSPDGSTSHDRACAAGYDAACSGTVIMAEAVASGAADAKKTLSQWTTDKDTKALLVNASLLVAGVGRSLGGEAPIWTLDLAATDDPSCH